MGVTADVRAGSVTYRGAELVGRAPHEIARLGVALVPQGRRVFRSLSVIENLTVEAPKTKLLSQKLQGMGLDSVLVITDTIDENLELASRNLPNVLVIEPKSVDPMSLVFYKKVLVTKAALAKIEEMYA